MYVNASQARIAQLLGEAARLLDTEDPTIQGRGVRSVFSNWILHHAKFSDAQRAELTGEFATGDNTAATSRPRTRLVTSANLTPDMIFEDGRRVSSVVRSVHTTTNAWGTSDKITYDIYFELGRAEEKVDPTRRWSVQY